jgi:hypothetical protein
VEGREKQREKQTERKAVSIAAEECSGAGDSRFCSHIEVKNGRIAAKESATPSLPEHAALTQRTTDPRMQQESQISGLLRTYATSRSAFGALSWHRAAEGDEHRRRTSVQLLVACRSTTFAYPRGVGGVTRPARYLDALLADRHGRPWAVESRRLGQVHDLLGDGRYALIRMPVVRHLATSTGFGAQRVSNDSSEFQF